MWMFLIAAGFAQEELCEPRTPEAVARQLDLATEALQNLNLSRAGAELELSREAARCLVEPIPPELMARLAYLHAEYGVFDQDLDTVYRWGRLAQDTAPDAPMPEHVAEDHPLRRFLEDAPEAPPIDGPDRVVLHPKKGGVYMDGHRLEVPEARRETPHFVQVFDNKERIDAWWQSGPRFKPEYLGLGEPEPEPEVGPKGWKPAKKNTVGAWEAWIAKNPDSEWVDEARSRLDLARYEKAAKGGEEGLLAYLSDDPGPNARTAMAAVEKIHFDEADELGTRQAWSVFLSKHPRGFYTTEAEGRLDELSWAKFSGEDTEEAYARYLTQHRDGAHRTEARKLLAERVFEAAVASGDERKLRAFWSRFPTSPNAPRALALIAGTRFDAIQLQIHGLDDDAPMEEALRTRLAETGVRVERTEFTQRVVNRELDAANGLIWVSVTYRESGLHAEAALWAPVGTAPLQSWRADADDPAGLVAAVVKGVPDLSEWR
ncbi:MAG: hypothetical protein R3F61_34820 [Myxococcota bacterium]